MYGPPEVSYAALWKARMPRIQLVSGFQLVKIWSSQDIAAISEAARISQDGASSDGARSVIFAPIRTPVGTLLVSLSDLLKRRLVGPPENRQDQFLCQPA